MATAPISTAGRGATNGTVLGKNLGNNQRHPMVDQTGHPQGKKKRNRSKKKRGKGGGSGGGNTGTAEVASARRTDGSSAGVQPMQKQKPMNQTPKQRLDQCQQPQTGSPTLPQQARPSSLHSKAPGRTAEGRTRTSDTARTDPEDLCGGMDHGEVGIAHEADDHRARDTPTLTPTGKITPHETLPVETEDPTTKNILGEEEQVEDLVVEKRGITVDEGKKSSATNIVAPFECSWTNAPNSNKEGKIPKSSPQGNKAGLKGGEDCGSEGSYQSFQQGDEESESQLEPSPTDVSDPVHSCVPRAREEQHRVGVTASSASPPYGVTGTQTTTNDNTVFEGSATSSMNAPGKRSKDRELREENGNKVSPNPMPQLHGTNRGGEKHAGGGYKGYGPGHNKNDFNGKALSVRSSTLSPRSLPVAQKSVRFEVDEERKNPRSDGDEAKGQQGSEDQALLLPEYSPTTNVSTTDGRNDEGFGNATDTSVRTESTGEEVMADDIDDESTALLDASPTAPAGHSETPSQFAMIEAAAAALRAPAPSSSSLSPASPRNGGTRVPVNMYSRAEAPGAATAVATPATLKTTTAAAPAKATAATFNYYELPPIPEGAPEVAAEPSPGQSVPTEASVRPSQRSSPLSESRPTVEKDGLGGIWAAVRRSDIAGVRAELESGATLDEADSEGRTPLMGACASGDTKMASLLVSGVSPPSSVAARTIEGWTPLMIASGGGRLGVVRVLLQAGAALHDRDDDFGSNSFMWACGGGHAEVARLMLDSGAKELLHSVNSDMWTPLMVACDAGSLETVQVLVEAGADLGAFNSDVHTAMDIAASRKNLLVENYLRTKGAPTSSMFWDAAETGNAEVISKLLRGNGHLVAALDANGRTALLRSCVGGHLKVAKVLVEAGADVDFQDSSGTSALSVSAVLGDMALTRYLVQAGGARLTVKNNAGWTPLMQAVVKGDLIMTRYLVDRGSAVNDGGPAGESVLDMAKRFSGAELQRYLAAKGGFSSQEVKRQIGEVNDGGRGPFRFW